MLIVPITREMLLQLLPPGGEVAEIGVYRGDFSAEILARSKPDRLHLIDPWEHQERADYEKDPANLPNEDHDDNMTHVRTRFAAEIEAGRVVLHRAYSNVAADRFADGSLDWVYVDGVHSYDGVLDDLTRYRPKLKPDGLILGHDFSNSPFCVQRGFDVVTAVGDFRKRHGHAMVAMTAEAFPSFVLAPEPLGENARLLREKILYNIPGVIEIRDFAEARYQHKVVTLSDGTRRHFHSF